MKQQRSSQYDAGDAQPEGIKKLKGGSQAEERKRMTAWLASRGEVKCWKRIKVGK